MHTVGHQGDGWLEDDLIPFKDSLAVSFKTQNSQGIALLY